MVTIIGAISHLVFYHHHKKRCLALINQKTKTKLLSSTGINNFVIISIQFNQVDCCFPPQTFDNVVIGGKLLESQDHFLTNEFVYDLKFVS